MGLLDKLWDDVVAGPQPDHGLGRLRRKPKVPGEAMDEEAKLTAERRRSADFYMQQEAAKLTAERRRSADLYMQQEEARRVTQSIAIAKPPPLLRTDSLDEYYNSGSTPSTPGAASTPTSSSFVGSPSVFDREKMLPKAASVPSSPALGSPGARDRENVWTSVFHPGSNKAMRKLGSEKFDKQAPNSPTVYDWVVLSALDR